MIFVNFDLSVLRTQLETELYGTVQYLQQAPKTFTVEVDDVEYLVEYEVHGTRIQFFAQAPESVPNLSHPVVRFNIGTWLLPEAMDGGKLVHPSDFAPAPEAIVHDTDPEISSETCQKIMEYVEKEGFLNLIHRN